MLRKTVWTTYELLRLKKQILAGATLDQIAFDHQRSKNSIINRLVKMHLLVRIGGAWHRVYRAPWATDADVQSIASNGVSDEPDQVVSSSGD